MAGQLHLDRVYFGQKPNELPKNEQPKKNNPHAALPSVNMASASTSGFTGDKMLPPAAGGSKHDPLDLTLNSQCSSSGGGGGGGGSGYDAMPNSMDTDEKEAELHSGYVIESASSGIGHEEAHRCDICGKTFAVPARLTRHYRTHTGERPFVCDICGKSFSVKENLSVHRRIHTKEKPYRCPHCGRGFEHSGKLHRHMRIHTGERPHQCSDCGKTFIQSGQLVIHMRSHTGEKPYVCGVCTKGFTCSKQLKVHSRTHTGERPYVCDVCGKNFAYNHVLKLHQMAHLGERLYKCTLCSETFSSKKALETHIKSHSAATRQSPPVASTSRAVSDQQHLWCIGRNQTSGGSCVDQELGLGTSRVTPAKISNVAMMETGSSRSPSSTESSRSSLSDMDGPGSSSLCDLAAVPSLNWQMQMPRDRRSNFAYPQLLNPSVRHRSTGLGSVEFKSMRHYSIQPQQSDCSSTYLRPMPPLIPVSTATPPSCSRSPLRLTSQSAPEFAVDCSQSDGPPRKSSRFRHGGDGERGGSGSGANSDGSSESLDRSPPSPTSSMMIMPFPTLTESPLPVAAEPARPPGGSRSTSVIRFAHRPNSTSSQPSSQSK